MAEQEAAADNEVGASIEALAACSRRTQPSGIRFDGCCPSGANPVNDVDCGRVFCGNGALDSHAAEVCDGSTWTKCIQPTRFCSGAQQCFEGDPAKQAAHWCTYRWNGILCSVVGGC